MPTKASETKNSGHDGSSKSVKKSEIDHADVGASSTPQSKTRRVSMSKSGSNHSIGPDREASPSNRRSMPPSRQDLTSSTSTITSLASFEINTAEEDSNTSQTSPDVTKRKSRPSKSAIDVEKHDADLSAPALSVHPTEVPLLAPISVDNSTQIDDAPASAAPTTPTATPEIAPIIEAPLAETPVASSPKETQPPSDIQPEETFTPLESPSSIEHASEEGPNTSPPEAATVEPMPAVIPPSAENDPEPIIESPHELNADPSMSSADPTSQHQEASASLVVASSAPDTAATVISDAVLSSNTALEDPADLISTSEVVTFADTAPIDAVASATPVLAVDTSATASPSKKKRSKKHKDKEDTKEEKKKEKAAKESKSKKSKKSLSPSAPNTGSPPRRRPKEKERQTSTLSSSGGSAGGSNAAAPPLSGSLGGSATDKSDRVEVIGVVEPSAITIVNTQTASPSEARSRKRTIYRISAIESDIESPSNLRESALAGTDNSEVLLPSPRSAEFAAVVSPKKQGIMKKRASARKHAGTMSPEERANVRRSLSAPLNENSSVRRKKRASFHAKSNARLDSFYPAASSDSESLSLSDEDFTIPSSPNFASAYDDEVEDGEWTTDAGDGSQAGNASADGEGNPSSPRGRPPTPGPKNKSAGLLIAASSSPNAPVGTSSKAAAEAASSSAAVAAPGSLPFPNGSVSSPSKRNKRSGPSSPAISPYKHQLQSFFSAGGSTADKKKKKSSRQAFIDTGSPEASIDIWDEPPTSTDNLVMEDTTESRTYVNTTEMARKGGGGLFIRSATLNKLIEHLTWVDYNEDDKTYAKIFLSCYESFTTPEVLMLKLVERFHVPDTPVSINGRKPVAADQWAITAHVIQSRVCSVMKMWIDSFSSSFGPKMTRMFNAFITEQLDPIKHRPVVTILTNALEERINKESVLLQRLLTVTGTNTLSKREAMKKSQSEGNVIPSKHHKLAHAIELLSIDDMAKQLTLGDYFVFNSIKPWELLRHTWDDEIPVTSSPLKELVQRFNQISSFVISVILSQRDVKARARLYTKFVKLAKHLFRLNNFNSLMAILGGLNHSCIARLSLTLSSLPRGAAKTIHKLDRFMSVKNNFGRYRERLAELSNQSCVPYLGLVLNDYMFIEESNAAADTSTSRTLLNFNRIKQLYYNCIEPLAQFQGHPYEFTISDPQIERLIQSQELLDQNDAYLRSISLEQDAS